MRAILFLVAMLVLIQSPAMEFVGAQTKKAADTGGTIEINEGKDGKYRFVIRDEEGKFIAMSGPTGFATAKEAEGEVTRLKAVLGKAKVTYKKKTEAKDTEPAKDKKKAPTKDTE